MPFSGDDITQEHVDIARNYGLRVAKTLLGQMVGADELEAQSMVVLWDLALSYEEDRGATFLSYLHKFVEPRLIDWLRLAYGRFGAHGTDEPSGKLRHHYGMRSLEALCTDDRGMDYDWLPDTAPGPEALIVRDDHDTTQFELFTLLLSQLTPRQQDAMLHHVRGETIQDVADRYGVTAAAIAADRMRIRAQLRADLGRDRNPYLHARTGGRQPAEPKAVVEPRPLPALPQNLCAVESCYVTAQKRGWCSRHYQRWWKYGDPTHIELHRQKGCGIDKCDRDHFTHGLCSRHWQQNLAAQKRDSNSNRVLADA